MYADNTFWTWEESHAGAIETMGAPLFRFPDTAGNELLSATS
jgi:hypothetical protein